MEAAFTLGSSVDVQREGGEQLGRGKGEHFLMSPGAG